MPGSSTASSSPSQSSPPPRMRAGARPVERPEGHGTIQSGSYNGHEGGSSRYRRGCEVAMGTIWGHGWTGPRQWGILREYIATQICFDGAAFVPH
ncbi:hypothetical protein N7530_012585 [Penicillium desertorum]|uniref:Uncharacterized protein n=1 Tax=Penicillium desertorum TaxID=1303715 RepID=A0A9W9WFU2_9EURO|nr:hypothetical protein N7530_012585 [Penicillium desertorum]